MGRTRNDDRRRVREIPDQLCQAWTTPWTAGSRLASNRCSAFYQIIIDGKLKVCVKHARIETMARVLDGKVPKLQLVSRSTAALVAKSHLNLTGRNPWDN